MHGVGSGVTERVYDTAVIGAGTAGLTAAGILARSGRSTILFEAHDKPGGSAGYYETGGFTFDAGATTLIGLEPGSPLDSILRALHIAPAQQLQPRPVDGVQIGVNGQDIYLGRDSPRFQKSVSSAFPSARDFLEKAEADATHLWDVTRRWPLLPILSVKTLLTNLRALSPAVLRLLPTLGRTVDDIRALYGAPSQGPFRHVLDLCLLITVQNTAEASPWWNGALGLNLFRHGVYRPAGGMKTFAETLLDAVRRAGTAVEMRTLVSRLRWKSGKWIIRTARGEEVAARELLANIPPEGIPHLLKDSPDLKAAAMRHLARPREGWGAIVLNLGLSRTVNPDPATLHYLLLRDPGEPYGEGNSLFLSFSPPSDQTAPVNGQTVSVSSHTDTRLWKGLTREQYLHKKARLRERILATLATRWPGIEKTISYEDIGTPRTFKRFVKREQVGGPRTSLANSGFRSVDPSLGLPAFQTIGDSVFPGAGTLAAAMSAVYSSERLGAIRITRDGEIRFRSKRG